MTETNQIVRLRTMASRLIFLATEPYELHKGLALTFLEDCACLWVVHETNPYMDSLWQIMLAPTGNMLGGFLRLWRTEEKLSRSAIQAIGGTVLAGFDELVRLDVALRMNDPQRGSDWERYT